MLKISTEIYFLFRFHPVEIKRAKSCPRRPTYPKSKIGKKNLVVFLNYQHRGRNLELGFHGIKKKKLKQKKKISLTYQYHYSKFRVFVKLFCQGIFFSL